MRWRKRIPRFFRQAENQSFSSSIFKLTELERLTELKSKMLFFREMFLFRELQLPEFFSEFDGVSAYHPRKVISIPPGASKTSLSQSSRCNRARRLDRNATVG